MKLSEALKHYFSGPHRSSSTKQVCIQVCVILRITEGGQLLLPSNHASTATPALKNAYTMLLVVSSKLVST